MPPKLIPSLRALASTVAALAHTRLMLAGVELEEEVQRFVSAAVLGVAALIFVQLALIVGTFTIVVAVAPGERVVTLVCITLLYTVIAVFALLRLRSIFANRPPIFAATLAELEKDKETLSQTNRAYQAAEQARTRGEPSQEDAFETVRPSGDGAERGSG